MLLREAQEQVRVLNAAIRNSTGGRADRLAAQVSEAGDTLRRLADRDPSEWTDLVANKDKTVGLMLIVVLGVANELGVDALEAMQATLIEESP